MMTPSIDLHDQPTLDAARPALPDRRVTPRTSLPSARAVVGGLLVAVAALGTFVAYRAATGAPSTSFVVAASDIDPGTRVGPGVLRLETMRLPDSVGRGAFTDVASLEGAVALAPLREGELVQASAVVPAGAGTEPSREFSFAVERTRALDGQLNRGERVDVLATYGSGDTARTHVVVRAALVTDVDNESGQTIGSATTVTVTLALTSPDDVLEAAHASQVAEVTLVRATKAGDDAGELDVYAGPGDP
jgi:Flp pilus assembly protein CpaB